MKAFLKIAFVLFVVMGLILLVATPIGFVFIAIGIIGFIKADALASTFKKSPKKKREPVVSPAITTHATPDSATSSEPSSVKTTQEVFKVAGTSFHENEIMTLAEENPCYDYSKRDLIDDGLTDERVYQHTFFPRSVELVDEPDNEYDPKAIKVVIDGCHVGYIKKGSTGRIRNLRKQGRIKRIEADIYGGKYKIVTTDEDDDGKERYEYEKDESPLSVKLTLYLYPEEE